MTTCAILTILQRPFFNLLHKFIRFSDIRRFSDSFCRLRQRPEVSLNRDCTVLKMTIRLPTYELNMKTTKGKTKTVKMQANIFVSLIFFSKEEKCCESAEQNVLISWLVKKTATPAIIQFNSGKKKTSILLFCTQ